MVGGRDNKDQDPEGRDQAGKTSARSPPMGVVAINDGDFELIEGSGDVFRSSEDPDEDLKLAKQFRRLEHRCAGRSRDHSDNSCCDDSRSHRRLLAHSERQLRAPYGGSADESACRSEREPSDHALCRRGASWRGDDEPQLAVFGAPAKSHAATLVLSHQPVSTWDGGLALGRQS